MHAVWCVLSIDPILIPAKIIRICCRLASTTSTSFYEDNVSIATYLASLKIDRLLPVYNPMGLLQRLEYVLLAVHHPNVNDFVLVDGWRPLRCCANPLRFDRMRW